MPRHSISILLALSLVGFIAVQSFGCGADHPEAQPKRTSYRGTGVVRSIHTDGVTVRVAHEEIRDYMPAMTMDFSTRERGELTGLKPGDRISFRLLVSETESWIDEVRRTSATISKDLTTVEPTGVTREQRQLRPGDRLPSVKLVDQNNRPFSVEELRGKVWALTFIFTRCPLPDYCPRLNRHFSAAQSLLAGDEGTKTRCNFLSVTIDPEHDTPERLAAFAKAYAANPELWIFATGKPEELARLSAAFGLEVSRRGELINHNLRTVIIGTDGRVQRVFVGNDWTPEELARELRYGLRVGER